MTPFMSNEGDKAPRYELYGVIVHIDTLNSSFFGHYICYVKDFGGVWYKIDDSQVNKKENEKLFVYLKNFNVFCITNIKY